MQELEKNSFTSFFKSKRVKELLLSGDCDIANLLTIVVGKESYFEQYLFDQQFSHQGWSGMEQQGKCNLKLCSIRKK